MSLYQHARLARHDFEASTDDAKRRRSRLVMAVAANLVLLAFFKYSGFLFTQVFHPLAII